MSSSLGRGKPVVMRILPHAVMAAVVLAGATAGAQPPPAPPRPPAPAGQPAPPAPAPAVPRTGPQAIEVTDPLLTPVPPEQLEPLARRILEVDGDPLPEAETRELLKHLKV